MDQDFSNATNGNDTRVSRGIIFSDCECTAFGLKDGTQFYKKYFIFLAAMKHSGYDVVFHSGDVNTNEELIEKMVPLLWLDPKMFEYNGYLVQSKESETAGMKGLVAFDDNHGSHGVQVQFKLDTNDPFVKAGIDRIADEFTASVHTKTFTFNINDFTDPALAVKAESPRPAAA